MSRTTLHILQAKSNEGLLDDYLEHDRFNKRIKKLTLHWMHFIKAEAFERYRKAKRTAKTRMFKKSYEEDAQEYNINPLKKPKFKRTS